MRRTAVVAAVTVLAGAFAGALPTGALGSSLYSGPGPRPGPALLYAGPAMAPQLTNAGVWRAHPILVSGATAYRQGEFLYQDFLYDDHGARELPDPNDPKQANQADLFSKSNGTYTYPTGPGYDNNAADLVELRVKPLRTATAFRITLNTLENPRLVAFSIAIGGRAGQEYAFPDGANVRAPASLFLTVHWGRRGLVAQLTRAASGRPVTRAPARVGLDMRRRQVTVRIPHKDWNPGRRTVRLAMGLGLWDLGAGKYLLPRTSADATHPGGAGTASAPPAFFNVAFRTHEPFEDESFSANVLTKPAWWRDEQQGGALASGDISRFYANVSFRKLARRVIDNSHVPKVGVSDRILASRFQTGQGAQFSNECGLNGASKPASCVPEYLGQLQPYAIYVPSARPPRGGYGMTLLLHSLSANYNQYSATRNQSQFGRRAIGSIVITPEARGPDQFYEGLGAADVFEVWADVARRYALNPSYSEIAGYSMGGFGTFKLGAQFPDLFARAQPTVAEETNTDVLASLRNIPVLMWNNSADELVPATDYGPTANKLDSLGYRYELDVFQPCPTTFNPQKCQPLFPNHLELAVNDQYAPAAAFLDSATVERNPAHVTYVEDAARNRHSLGIDANHAYWLSGIGLASPSRTASNGDPEGEIDAFSHGFGASDPIPSSTQVGHGTLTGGNLGPLQFVSTSKTWLAPIGTPAPRADAIDIKAANIDSVAIAVARAHVDCHVTLNVTTDSALTIALPGCGRVVHAAANSSSSPLPIGLPPIQLP